MKPSFKEKLFENWVLKILAILLAGILWLFIQGESGTVTTVTAQVISRLPDGMEISRGLPSTVQVTIRGAAQNLTCNIDLQNYDEGEHRITLTKDNIETSTGFGIEVSQFNPSQITLTLEKTLANYVPITVPVQGEVATGFEIYEKIPNMKVVQITGPRSHIEPIKEIPTDIIDLSGLDQTSRYQVYLNFEDGSIRSSITDPIWVEIRIGPRRKDYTVTNVPVEVEDASYVVSPKQINIRVMAPENLQPQLVPDNFSAKIPTQDLNESNLPARIRPVISYQEDWIGKIKEMGTRPSEVTVSRNTE
jgi:YbbR domain-containing protein